MVGEIETSTLLTNLSYDYTHNCAKTSKAGGSFYPRRKFYMKFMSVQPCPPFAKTFINTFLPKELMIKELASCLKIYFISTHQIAETFMEFGCYKTLLQHSYNLTTNFGINLSLLKCCSTIPLSRVKQLF